MHYASKTWRNLVWSARSYYKYIFGFYTWYAWQGFLVDNFANFPDEVRVKKIKIMFSHW